MRKNKLLKKIIKYSTKGMDKLIKDQEEIINGDIHTDETKIGCNYTIGYATAVKYYRKSILELLNMSKKELKKYIKKDKKITKQNKKYLKDVFKDIETELDENREN